MNIFQYELKKLLYSPAMLVFLALCLGFNAFITVSESYYDDYSDYVAKASKTTGYKLGVDFEKKIANLEPGERREYFEQDTKGRTDVFDDYDTVYIATSYISKLGLTGVMAKMMTDKYAKLQIAVDQKATSDESLTLYFAGATYEKHRGLYGVTFNFLMLECGLLAALVMLLSLGYEHSNRTALVVYATKTGRKVVYHKLLAGMTAGLASYVVLAGLTLVVYFVFNDYGSIWGSSVSSGFNYMYDILAGSRPFATWQSYSIVTYLLAVLGISALLTLCFALMAFCIGVWLQNSYIGFLVFLIVNAVAVALAIAVPIGMVKYGLALSPVWLWLKQSLWFTDGGADILWKNFETRGVCVSLLLLVGLCLFSAVMFKRRNIT